jgi:hypothetical protein
MVFKDIRELHSLRQTFPINDGVLSTLKVFRYGEPNDYTGPRKADGIVSYLIKYVVIVLPFGVPVQFPPLQTIASRGCRSHSRQY